MGMEKTKSLTRDVLLWPGMGKQMEASWRNATSARSVEVPTLKSASSHTPSQGDHGNSWEPTRSHGILKISSSSQTFTADTLKWSRCTSSALITRCKAAFKHQGIPGTLISNNGPCYSSTAALPPCQCTYPFPAGGWIMEACNGDRVGRHTKEQHIQTSEGQMFRCNRWHLHVSKGGPDFPDTQDTHIKGPQKIHIDNGPELTPGNNTHTPHLENKGHPPPDGQPPVYTTRSGCTSRPRQVLDL